MNIVYLVFGDKMENYQQVYFSIFTAMANKSPEDRIVVLAEDTSLFNFFEDSIEVIPINRVLIKEWEGKHHFFWRVKIKALQLVAEKYPSDSILYLDGDTFFYKNVKALGDDLNNGQNFMHQNEGKLSERSPKTEKLMWKQMKGKTFHKSIIDENSAMWNAGLIAVSNKHLSCLDYTLEVNDAMCEAGVTRRLIEQFAFSVGLNEFSSLKSAEEFVGHYWGNKYEWNNFIDLFLKRCFMKKYTLVQVIEEIKVMDLTQFPVRIRNSSTQRKMKAFIDSFYQDRKEVFVAK